MSKTPAASASRSLDRKRFVIVAIALVAMPWTSSTMAGKVYRCGNAFQDQPCPEPKPVESRPTERVAGSKDRVPCVDPKDASGRNDCLAKSRDSQPPVLIEAKR